MLFSSNPKNLNRKEKFSYRYDKKNVLFRNLKNIDETKITNKLISKLLYLIKNYWNFEENNFINSKGRDKSKKIFMELLEISIDSISKKQIKIKKTLLRDKNVAIE